MTCNNCGAAMRLENGKDYFTCDFCKNICVPEPDADGLRILGEAASLNCPICRLPLVHAAAGPCRLLACERCRGVLASMEMFVALVQHLRSQYDGPADAERPPEPTDLERKIRCPQCGDTFDTHFYAGPGNVVIDNCPRCGLNWLDHLELRRIVRAPDRQYNEEGWLPPEDR